MEKPPDGTLEAFVGRCLYILDKRYGESRAGRVFVLPDTHKPKRFSERELSEETGLNWPALKDGRRRALPTREMVMAIADYLECSLNERNDLLTTAHYLPVDPLLEGDALAAALPAYRTILLKYLHYPAYIINRNWDILDYNPAALLLFGITAADLAALPQHMKNVLWQIFDPAMPMRPMIAAVGADYWQDVARRALLTFRLENRLYTREGWYADLVARLSFFAQFEKIYASADPANYATRDPQPFSTKFVAPSGQCVNIVDLFIRTGSPDFPQIVTCVPGDRATEEFFEAAGFALPAWYNNYIL